MHKGIFSFVLPSLGKYSILFVSQSNSLRASLRLTLGLLLAFFAINGYSQSNSELITEFLEVENSEQKRFTSLTQID